MGGAIVFRNSESSVVVELKSKHLCTPDVDGLRVRILEEEHGSLYSIHPVLTKINHDLREIY